MDRFLILEEGERAGPFARLAVDELVQVSFEGETLVRYEKAFQGFRQ